MSRDASDRMEGDERGLRQVLWNQLGDCPKFTPEDLPGPSKEFSRGESPFSLTLPLRQPPTQHAQPAAPSGHGRIRQGGTEVKPRPW